MEHSAHESDHFRDRVCRYECAVIARVFSEQAASNGQSQCETVAAYTGSGESTCTISPITLEPFSPLVKITAPTCLEGTKKAWVFTPVSEPEWSTIMTPLWTMICQPRPIPAEMWQGVPGVSWVQTCSRASSEVQSRVITRRSAAMAGLRPSLRITLATKRA